MKVNSNVNRCVTAATVFLIALTVAFSGPFASSVLAVPPVIYAKVTFNTVDPDDLVTLMGVTGDAGGPYVDGQDRVQIRIGRRREIHMDFNSQDRKPSMRKLHFPSGFPTPVPLDPNNACYPTTEGDLIVEPTADDRTNLAPLIVGDAQNAELIMQGENHDDTPVDCEKFVGARLMVVDDNGETWFVFYKGWAPGNGSGITPAPCGDSIIVKRLPDTPAGKSQWSFKTSGTGSAYVFRANNDRYSAEFWGTIELPMSGIIESLTDETAPTGACN